jgi:hypothetical protein
VGGDQREQAQGRTTRWHRHSGQWAHHHTTKNDNLRQAIKCGIIDITYYIVMTLHHLLRGRVPKMSIDARPARCSVLGQRLPLEGKSENYRVPAASSSACYQPVTVCGVLDTWQRLRQVVWVVLHHSPSPGNTAKHAKQPRLQTLILTGYAK